MWIALGGGLAYSSWPLAFLVNPALAGTALASSFEGRSQPFSWLFILLDGIAGSCAATVAWRELRPRGSPRPGRAPGFALLGYGAFGIATAADAVVPLRCGQAPAQACASQLWPLTADDCLTGVAMMALFAAAVTVVARLTRRPLGRPGAVAVAVTLTGWSALGLAVLLGGSPALAAACQYAFLTLTSVLAVLVPLGVTSGLRGRPAARFSPGGRRDALRAAPRAE